jgi:hypothetical protein
MIDEYGNDCAYDFKSIKYYDENWDRYVFTFTWIDDNGNVMDASIFGNDGTLTYYGEILGVTNNIIKPYYSSYDYYFDEYFYNKQFLNNIVFISDHSYEECGNEGFGGYYNNSFDNNCFGNTFGISCCYNTFGCYCYDNNFGNDCCNNILGNACTYNDFGDSCNYNILGNNCYQNVFKNECNANNLSVNCASNIFGNQCSSNIFGNDCNSNILGSVCTYNIFGNFSYSNKIGNFCHYNTFGNSCCYNILSINNGTSSPKDFCNYNHFDDGCSYNIIWNATTSNYSNKLQNVHIKHGVSGTFTKYNKINITTLNNNYCITVANSSNGGDLLIYCEEDSILNSEIDSMIENILNSI